MSTIEHLSSWDLFAQPVDKLLTAADLGALPDELPSGLIDYELDNGRLVLIMAPPGDVHGAVQLNIGAYLKVWGEYTQHGKARSETGLILWRDPDRVVCPDLMFAANKSLPIRTSAERYWETIPELVVEVRSKNDSSAYIRRKVEHYLKAGVEIVWVVEPASNTVMVHSATGNVATYGIGDALTLSTIIPEFSRPIADVFRE